MNFTIRDAVPGDSEKLIKLTNLSPMKGAIGLRIDRNPNFFSLLELSESYILLIAENKENEIIGSFAATKNQLYIMGKQTIAYYLRDLKIHPYKKDLPIAYMLVKKMYERLKSINADILYCTAAAGNNAVIPFFEGRSGIPSFVNVSNFNVYELLPKANRSEAAVLMKSNASAGEFISSEYSKKYAVYPTGLTNDINSNNSINVADEENGKINAFINGFNPSAYKQNIVTSYSFAIRLLLSALRFLKLFLPFAPLPKKNEPLKILYVRYYAYAQNRKKEFVRLLKSLCCYAYKKQYHFVSIAVDEKDVAVNKIIKPLSKFVFKSSLMMTSLNNNEKLLQQVKAGILFEDYALV
jgi:hypothetical protein